MASPALVSAWPIRERGAAQLHDSGRFPLHGQLSPPSPLAKLHTNPNSCTNPPKPRETLGFAMWRQP